ncbi:uncharacterized SAM-binding protein YcdF (DUF218 family) [Arcicella aurantiaca]|uniref:Uncharacterized SAM-binding protein YcdF (DUF218 family) n=1 Tax=Arcicella aurantiaca TaxID=591202 RepID=A0A316EI45_9BACT|nr:YdcF family protein [Arcicella aurantiaca]PWK29441.1 uncharacterized SAM-binding protein YcdF (DUF218 family) [Arcicella aurantiaca]
MFYFLSKVLFYILMPLSLITICLLFALFCKNPKHKKRSVQICLGLILFFSNGFLSNEVLLWWEVPPTSPSSITTTYDVGIILTGGMITNKLATESQILTDKTADRFIQPLRLYKMGKLKKILISGGNTDLVVMHEDVSDETLKVAQLLEELGVKKEDIILERRARNTRENGLFTAEILNKNQKLGSKYILFTSAFHIRRAEGCFSKAGLSVTLFPTAYKAKVRSWTLDNLLIPRESNLYDSYTLIHELTGYAIYKILGYC